MREPPQHRAHLALPLGLMGLVGAWLVADFYRLDLHGREGSARSALLLLVPPVGAGLGWLLSARALSRTRGRAVVAVVLGTACAGLAVGAALGVSVYAHWPLGWLLRSGLVTGFAFVPVVGLVTWLARRVGRARAGSLVDASDQRAPFTLLALAVALAQLPVMHGERTSRYVVDLPPETTNAYGLLALVALVGLLAVELSTFARARAVALELASLQPRTSGSGLPCDDIVDLGLGDDEHEAYDDAAAGYRRSARPTRVVRGDPAQALPPLRGAVLRTALALLVATPLVGIAHVAGASISRGTVSVAAP